MSASKSPMPSRRGWFKSSKSNGSCHCVEVLMDLSQVRIRDSKYRRNSVNSPNQEPIISVDVEQWTQFLAEVEGHQLPAESGKAVTIQHDEDGSTSLTCRRTGVVLSYTAAEWVAFEAGVHTGEFRLVDSPAR
jgi:hypothetical protein